MLRKILSFFSEVINIILKKQIVLVYTMGKVGTTSITKTLDFHEINPTIHIHQFNFQREDDREPTTLYDYKSFIISWLIKILRNHKKIKIISLVRNPISRNMSSYFQNVYRYDKHTYNKGKKNIDVLINDFLNNYNHEYALNWFDNELKEIFEIDIFESDFNKRKGYSILKKGNVEVLLIKTEKIQEQGVRALNEFLSFNINSLVESNKARKKEYYSIYKQFKENIRFEESYIKKMYNSKLARHFYTQHEINNFISKLQIK